MIPGICKGVNCYNIFPYHENTESLICDGLYGSCDNFMAISNNLIKINKL